MQISDKFYCQNRKFNIIFSKIFLLLSLLFLLCKFDDVIRVRECKCRRRYLKLAMITAGGPRTGFY